MDHGQHAAASPAITQRRNKRSAKPAGSIASAARGVATRRYASRRARHQHRDPGTGLGDKKHRVLNYADLSARQDHRPPTREIQLHLTGNMERYMWSFDGISYMNAAPLHMTYSERLRMVFVNDTMMKHPIHLHGMWSDLETGT